ncbi:uncharacterized protein LOC135077955 [Ostrinia nubilalis]|uniref:uncharacterized protein LOC135077955 n=1 Tax=Ostrinia nubilalis TaxID=29057 RepID=UPI00308227C9
MPRRDEPNMSDTTLLVSVEDLINMAMGPSDKNVVNFKLIQTVLHILARQMRMLEQRVEIRITDARESSPKRKMDEIKEERKSRSPEKRVSKDRAAKREVEKLEKAALKEKEKAERAASKDRERADRAVSKEREKAEKAAAKERDKADRAASKERDKADRAESKEREKAEKAAAKEKEKAERAASKERDKADRASSKERDKADKTQVHCSNCLTFL